MQAFTRSPTTLDAAASLPPVAGRASIIAGGSDLMQLMKDNVEARRSSSTSNTLGCPASKPMARDLRLEAMARMSDVAANPACVRTGR